MSASKIRIAAALAAATFSAALPAHADGTPSPSPAQQSVSPLATAKTIQVNEVFSVPDKSGTPEPFFRLTVQIARPDRIRVTMVPASRSSKAKTSFYVVSGSTQHEYNGLQNTYDSRPASADGKNSPMEPYFIADLDDVLHPGKLPSATSGVQRALSETTLDGQPMTLTTDTYPARKGSSDGSSIVEIHQLWTDAKTGLPVRYAVSTARDGKVSAGEQNDFSGWTLDQPIPAARFAFVPPAGASDHVIPTTLPVGTAAPDFQVAMSDGTTVHLSDFKGKVVVLDFWATWCGPCQASMPHLEKVYQQIKGQPVAVLGLCVWDEKDAYDKWVAKNVGTTYHFPVGFDPAGHGAKSIASRLYGVSGIPTQYLIDKSGNVAAVTTGYQAGDTQLETNLGKLGISVPVAQAADFAK